MAFIACLCLGVEGLRSSSKIWIYSAIHLTINLHTLNDKVGCTIFISWNIDGGSVNSGGVSTNSDGVCENGGDVLRRESCKKRFAVNI